MQVHSFLKHNDRCQKNYKSCSNNIIVLNDGLFYENKIEALKWESQ